MESKSCNSKIMLRIITGIEGQRIGINYSSSGVDWIKLYASVWLNFGPENRHKAA